MRTTTRLAALFIVFYLAKSEKLKCFQCSDKDNDPKKKCSVNETIYSEATEDTGVACRIWAIAGVAVHKSMVSTELCKNETLQYNIQNDIVGKFEGSGQASALCCNWTLCNYNTTLAALAEEPSSAIKTDAQSFSINLSALFSILVASQLVLPLL